MLLLVLGCGSSGTNDGSDRRGPVITSVTPSNGVVGVSPYSYIQIEFSEPVEWQTVNPETIQVRANGWVEQLFSFSLETPTTVMLSPAIPPRCGFLGESWYSVTVTTGVRDTAGNPLAKPVSWVFETGRIPPDTTVPTITSVSPADQEGDVAINRPIEIKFSEAMDQALFEPSQVVLILRAGTSEIPSVSKGLSTLSDASRCLESHARVLAVDLLQPETTYSITMEEGLRDLAGNLLPAVPTWSFTTSADGLIRAIGWVRTLRDEFVIYGDDDRDYRPTNLPPEFARDGAAVRFTGRARPDLVSTDPLFDERIPIDLVEITEYLP